MYARALKRKEEEYVLGDVGSHLSSLVVRITYRRYFCVRLEEVISLNTKLFVAVYIYFVDESLHKYESGMHLYNIDCPCFDQKISFGFD